MVQIYTCKLKKLHVALCHKQEVCRLRYKYSSEMLRSDWSATFKMRHHAAACNPAELV